MGCWDDSTVLNGPDPRQDHRWTEWYIHHIHISHIVRVYIYIYTHTSHIYIYLYIYIHICVYIYICIHILLCIYIYTHTSTDSQKNSSADLPQTHIICFFGPQS